MVPAMSSSPAATHEQVPDDEDSHGDRECRDHLHEEQRG
jgi:hypothetical protein